MPAGPVSEVVRTKYVVLSFSTLDPKQPFWNATLDDPAGRRPRVKATPQKIVGSSRRLIDAYRHDPGAIAVDFFLASSSDASNMSSSAK